jgi:hypothetical protein
MSDVHGTPDLTQIMVMAAVQSYDRGGDVLTSSGFACVVHKRFKMDRGPTQEWAAEVLAKLPYVRFIEAHHWKYLPGSIGFDWDEIEGELKPLPGTGYLVRA